MSTVESLGIIGIVAVTTFATRVTPFLLFPDNKKTPSAILFLGRVLPPATMGLLVIYCLKSVSIITYPYGIPEFLAVLTVAALHLWKRNTFLSIGAGTVLYMLFVQFIFV